MRSHTDPVIVLAEEPAGVPPGTPALADRLAAEGFTAGLPAGLPPAAAAVDRLAVKHMRCPHCRKGLEYGPHRKGRQYRVLATCATCGFSEEF